MTSTSDRPDPYGPRLRKLATTATAATATEAFSATAPAESAVQGQADLLRAGLRAMLHERPEEARECLEALATPESLAAREPLAVDGLAYLSSVRWSQGDIDGAMEASDSALDLAPERFAPNQKAGEMALRLGNSDRAAELFLAALRASEPGTADAKAAEASLREARRRVSRGIRHEARAPRLSGHFARLVRRRWRDAVPRSVTSG